MPPPAQNFFPANAAPPTQLVDRVNLGLRVRRYWKLFRHRWFIVAGCLIVGAGYSAYRAYRLPNRYRAMAVLGLAQRVQTTTSGEARVSEGAQDFYNKQLVLMKSSGVTKLTLERLTADWPSTNAPPDYSAFSADAGIGNGSTFNLSADSTNADFARRYVNAWAQAFIKFKRSEVNSTIAGGLENTLKELANQEKKLQDARDETLRFQQTNNWASSTEMLSGERKRLDDLIDELRRTTTQRQRLEQASNVEIAIGAQDDTSKPPGDKPPSDRNQPGTRETADPLVKYPERTEFLQLDTDQRKYKREWDKRVQSLQSKHPFMVELAEKISANAEEIKHRLDVIDQLKQAQIRNLKINEENLAAQKKALDDKVLSMIGVQNAFESLKKKEELISSTVDKLTLEKSQFELANPEQVQFNIIEPGSAGYFIGPFRSRMIFNGLFAGLLVGIGIIYLLHRLDDRLEMAEDIEELLEQPVLGQVPLVDLKSKKESQVLITRLHQHDMFAEALRGVRSAVLLGPDSGPRQVLLVTSAVPGDGKTTFTVNFAATLATAGHRVLLVDADLRRGNTHSYFGLARENGLVEVLAGESHWSDVLKETELKTLHVITSGRIPPNPGELLGSPTMTHLVKEVRANFDFIVFDCPPLTGLDDSFVVLKHSDGMLFVVRAGQTSMRFAQIAVNAVIQRGGKLLGIVLNGITADNPYYYYNYYYHSYYNKAQQEPIVDVGSIPKPAQEMARARTARYKTMSIDAVARARTDGERPSTREIAEEERLKAEAYKARRAAARPALENQTPPPAETDATTS